MPSIFDAVLVNDVAPSKAALRSYMNAREVISVKDVVYGAIGDGVNDDTVEIQAALTAAGVAPLKRVWIPAGTYLVSASLTVPNGVVIQGEGRDSTAFNWTGTGHLFLIGSSDSALNYRNVLSDFCINCLTLSNHGVRLRATVGAVCERVDVNGYYGSFDTRTNIAFDIDGANISAFGNHIRDCRGHHIHQGIYIRTTGSTGPTAQRIDNFYFFGDYAQGDTDGIGIFFENAGVDTVITGGNLEDVFVGIRNDGTVAGTAYTALGVRFEATSADLQMNATGAGMGITVLGSPTLSAAKVNDNSASLLNTIQYGAGGTVGVSGRVVVAGTIVNAVAGTIYGNTKVLADDAAFSITPPQTNGVLIVSGNQSQADFAMLSYTVGAGALTPVIRSAGTTNVQVTTGVLSGTTGSDTALTISAHTNGLIYIENRRGYSMTVRYEFVQ